MDTETTTEGDVDTSNNEGEGKTEEEEVVTLKKEEYDTLNQTMGSLKKELKDLRKAQEKPKEDETPEQNQKLDDALLQKIERLAFRQEGITHDEDKELARKTAKKWGMDLDEVLADEDFKVKLEKQQSARTNVEATSNIKGGNAGQSQAKNTSEYWEKKGTPPTPKDVPDTTTRRKIIRDMLKTSKGDGKMKFYNS